MDEIKNKVLNVINKQRSVKIPNMGFSEHFLQNVSLVPESYSSSKGKIDDDEIREEQSPDEEVLQSIEGIYYKEDADTSLYELKKLTESEFDLQTIDKNMKVLKQQQKVISKKVLQLILDQRNACTEEFQQISETEKELQQSVWTCQKARSYLNFAKQTLTTSSLEILAAYRKREIILQLLKILKTLKSIKMTDQTFQRLIDAGTYSEAIALLLLTKTQTEAYKQYKCIESFTQKIQDTLIMTEVQLETVLNDLTTTFDNHKYTELQKAYKLLGKSLIAMDQLHMNFISAIHSTAFSVLKSYVLTVDEAKLVFEQLCENIPADKYIDCLVSMCKAFWKILVCYNQIVTWHQSTKLDEVGEQNEDGMSNDEYVQEKLKKGQFRLWNDIQGKICLYINSSRIHQLKYEHFIQALAIMQRLKKVGIEFCDEPSEKLMETIQKQSMEFFDRYHRSCLEEIALFIDHEAWVQLTSFISLTQLQEYRTVKRALIRHKCGKPLLLSAKPAHATNDTDSTNMSQDESSIYGSCGYFLRFNEKSSPFDGGFDAAMLEEDILAGIADESSCYYSEDSDEYEEPEEKTELIISNSSLTVLRCIGRYLQMCRLLHSISPRIVTCMTELIDYHIYAVHELFSKDLPVAKENLYSAILDTTLKRIHENVLPKVKKWPPSLTMIAEDLSNPEQLFGLAKRVIAVECCIHLIVQFQQLQGYLTHLLVTADSERRSLEQYYDEAKVFTEDLRKPIYMAAVARVVDVQPIMVAMSKVKWDIQHVTVQHSAYIDTIHRSIQLFAMRLEEISNFVPLPRAAIWNNLAHVLTHMLVEGYSIAKKCSLGGRALMQLDFTHFMSLLELISGQKFPEHQMYVEQYVKAYYLPKDLLEEFIKNQSSYSTKHMTGLINCTCSNDKKTRQHLLSLVEITTNGVNNHNEQNNN